MEIKSITRIDGKIRIISANSGHERVDDFDDYGLPEVDYLIKSFLENDVVYVVESGLYGEDIYMIGNYSYMGYRYISGSKSETYNCICIEKSITTIRYNSFTCIIYGCARFTTNIASWKWGKYIWLHSKKFVKQFDGRHITEQSLEIYGALVGYCYLCHHMEVMIGYRSVAKDLLTKLQCPWHGHF